MIRAVVFDLWNTLVHSAHGDPFQHLASLLDEAQRAHFRFLKRDAMIQPHASGPVFLERWRSQLGLSDAQLRAMAAVWRQASQDAQPFPEVLEALDRTHKVARLGLLSNTQSFDMAFLDRLGITERIAVRCLSWQTGHLKPEPGAFAAVQKQLGLPPSEIVMVGDSWNDDMEGALAVGWRALWVNRAGHPRPRADAAVLEIPDLSVVPDAVAGLRAGAH